MNKYPDENSSEDSEINDPDNLAALANDRDSLFNKEDRMYDDDDEDANKNV